MRIPGSKSTLATVLLAALSATLTASIAVAAGF